MLSHADQELATSAGQARFARRRAAGSQQRYGRDASTHTVELEIEAIGAEIEVARLIGREWIDTDRPDYDGDVGPGVQVRHTRHLRGRLILHAGDRDEHDFFLVVGTYPALEVIGWITGAEGKAVGKVKELQPGRPCICVEQDQLRSAVVWREPGEPSSDDTHLSAREQLPGPPASEDGSGSVATDDGAMPWFIRKAILAQGKCDPDEIAARAAVLDLSAPLQEEIRQEPLIADPIPEIPEPML